MNPRAARHSLPGAPLWLASVFCFLLAFAQAAPEPLELEYRLRLLRPATHLMEVEITAGTLTEKTLHFRMPAWSPGRYAIYDFAKNAQEFAAFDTQGQALRWTKTDKQTWQVEARDAQRGVRVRYRVFANDLSGSFSEFDASHASLNPASIFMYLSGHTLEPLRLSVELPASENPSWKFATPLSLSTEEKIFAVPSYDVLADSPIEISAGFSVEQFQVAQKTFRVVVHAYPEPEGGPAAPPPMLVDGLKKIVQSQMASLPPDFDHYTFIFHFDPEIPLGDGIEHANSAHIVVRGNLDAAGLAEALETAAHEFFHLWNGKRLRPAGLGPFDYSRETYVRSLWFVEGVTSYYTYLHLLRSGLWTRDEFLKRLAEEIRELEAEPGSRLMSAESSSFDAWFYDRAPQMQQTNFANSTISYYNKGLLVALLLDLEVRARTNGRKSLDDVLRSMYREFYQQAPAVKGWRGSGYQDADILRAVNAVSEGDFTPFFERYVSGTEPLLFDATLGHFGLALHRRVANDSAPSLGVLTQRIDAGLKIVATRPGGAADRAGLSRDDVLSAVDELSLAAEELDERLKIYPPGAEVPFAVQRHGREERITVTLDPPSPNLYSIEELPGAAPGQIALRTGWLGS